MNTESTNQATSNVTSTTQTTSSTTTAQTTVDPTCATIQPLSNSDILSFLESVKKFTVLDIIKLQSVAVTSEDADNDRAEMDKGIERCTTALASLCFATVEQLGMLLRTDLNTAGSAKNAVANGNIANAIAFFEYAQQKGLTTVDNSLLKVIYILFRNKITHNLFPKHNLGVCQNKSNDSVAPLITINGSPSLNLNFLANYVLSVIDHFEKDVNDQQQILFVNRINNNLALIKTAEEDILKEEHSKAYTLYPQLATELKKILPNFNF